MLMLRLLSCIRQYAFMQLSEVRPHDGLLDFFNYLKSLSCASLDLQLSLSTTESMFLRHKMTRFCLKVNASPSSRERMSLASWSLPKAVMNATLAPNFPRAAATFAGAPPG